MLKRCSVLIILCLCSVPCRAGAAQIELREVVSGLNRPLFLTHSGDGSGRIFIVEQTGFIRILDKGSLLGTPFLDISSGFNLTTAGERGLLGLAFHPDYTSNGRFFINYTRNAGQLQTVIQEHQVSGNPNVAGQNGEVLQYVIGLSRNPRLSSALTSRLETTTGDGWGLVRPMGISISRRVTVGARTIRKNGART